ncbi:keratin, type I cytoskeletal 19-like [Solea solea]|uniref:keratin, type I cytoskeletal 19-like n=1 Tax=Solea solea TaxID=90069 RepID=UPI00272B97A4|nr:keratin, type I cytoskeletal 19-like [Solea solea]
MFGQSRSSARSISSASSSLSISGGGMQMVGGGQVRISTGGQLRGRAPSVYGGAGGSGTRVSQAYSMMSSYGSGSGSVYGSGSMATYGEAAVITNEKLTMQNLNDRLASYLEKVRSLEAANKRLELQIREYYEKRTFIARDYTGFFATITELQAKIARRHSENQSILLQIDNARLATDDFKIKYEMEMNMRSMVEADVTRLRGVRDSLTLNSSDLEMQIEGMKEELAFIKTNHQEELRLLRAQQSGCVNVEVDSTESVDMTRVLQELREQYEALAIKNKQDMEKWFQLKMDGLQIQITTVTTEVDSHNTQLSELKRTYQSLEINRESIITEMQCLQQNVKEVNSRYSIQLNQLQVTINTLEVELQQLRVSLEQQRSEYNLLLDIKMRLEMEIAEYRRLLEGEHYERKAVVISKVVEVEVEEHKPHIERRVKTIVEEIIDGKIVSSTVDTQVEDIQ